ncbi:FAD/NAD(P)-binding domain-containing protein [Macrolepiota fuliginosa MF-IS2]|uniref:FAD/NAD(P)-binding domain-containing protein n=1 Tax=Macrolepiota fuliginosa MF-IS2 TaxID=1400762 RepID=A0A9P5XG97_9AGAR|nr:FAD/NAD(P)-binding domain-containing protein [Macrolepiota fuliginosa MF-IS2]
MGSYLSSTFEAFYGNTENSTKTVSEGAEFKSLRVAIIGGGLGGLSAAVSLRRAGHQVDIYERRDFDVEVGASISCAANGTQWLREWEVDIPDMKPVVLMNLVMRDWETGKVLNDYNLEGYEKEWGNVYNMLHRQDMHATLLKAVTSPEGLGTPCKVHIDHICDTVDTEKGTVTFKNGQTIQADLIVGADGIRSAVRKNIGVVPDMKSAPQTCYRCNVLTSEIKRLGLVDYAYQPAIQFWGGMQSKNGRSKYYKIVMSPCSGGEVVSFYCFMPTEMTNHHEEGFTFKQVPVEDILKGAYDKLDPDCRALLSNSVERMPWRLYVHQPYNHWYKDQTCILGDAVHPMMPHQSQGACQAIEDAAALGIIFSRKYARFTNDINAGLELYQNIRKPRATRVQLASARATENLNERIGFTSLTAPDAELKAKEGKLTVNEMNSYKMHDHVAEEVAKLYPVFEVAKL